MSRACLKPTEDTITSNSETEDILEKERVAADLEQLAWKLTETGWSINAPIVTVYVKKDHHSFQKGTSTCV